ncbi:Uncharacterized protein involved in exopolysaccharide biosynthesis [Rhodoblastus acidophilus]|uniref:Uncharacterized protein involved in exopolysaccharide biosynthesis n=2 Tax=Rhodoblastus acidophilus TaxID=1074 RepID=A0A212REL2_RHOAC|nr:hypothetical protein [Rhodoblastus acidophilus]SNB70803.1 Uncharacterized protein involved in exopolysaccharide biosynthesis [Rhodoblastus acidophilus]
MGLPLFLLVLRKRLRLAAAILGCALCGAAAALLITPARYDAVAVASIDPSSADPVSGLGPAPGSVLIVQGNLAALARSNQVALDVVRRLDFDRDPEIQRAYSGVWRQPAADIRQFAAQRLLERLEVRFLPGSNVLTIGFRAAMPEHAATVANAFMTAFIDAAVALKGQSAQKAADWFAPQIEKAAARLADSRGRLESFQTEARLLAPGANDSEADRLLSIGNALSAAKTELVALQSQLATPGAGANDAQNPDVQTLVGLRASLASAEADIARLKAEAGASHPKMIEKQALRESLRAQIAEQTDAYRAKLAERVAAQMLRVARMEKTYADNLRDMVGVQAQRDRLAQLRAEIQFQQDEVDRLQRAASQARLQSQLSFSNIAVIDRAAPPANPAAPKPLAALALAGGAGLGLAVLGALIVEALDRRIRRPEDLAEAAGAPLLGVAGDFSPPAGAPPFGSARA